MPATPSYQYNVQDVLRPAYNDEDARCLPVALAAGTYERGTVLGQLTTAGVNDVQTITITGVPTGGTWTYTAAPPGGVSQVLTEAYNVPLATLQTDLEGIYGHGNVVVTGTAGTSYVTTFTGSLARTPITLAVVSGAGLTGGTTPAAAIAHTTTGAGDTGQFTAYASGLGNGAQTAKMLLMYPCTVDAAGNITIGTASDIPGLTAKSVPAYYVGTFRTEELVGLDANAVTNLGGVVVQGNLTAGIFRF